MLAKIMKWISSVALLLMAVFSGGPQSYNLLFSFLVFMGAVIVLQQAVGAREYLWAAGFVAIALLFNPVVPIPRPTGDLFLLMIFVCLAPFAISLAALKTQPLLSIPSITDRCPGSESL